MRKDPTDYTSIAIWMAIVEIVLVLKAADLLPISWGWALLPVWGPVALALMLICVMVVAFVIAKVIRIIRNGKAGR